MNPEICIIAAMSENRVIGKDGQIPWRIPEDLRRFKELTTPHPIIMGRKTFDSIGRPLPKRSNIVLSRDIDFNPIGIYRTPRLKDAISFASELDKERIFIIGGGEIYRQTLYLTQRLFLTVIDGNFEGDTYFPNYSVFNKVVYEEHRESNGFRYRFLELEKTTITN